MRAKLPGWANDSGWCRLDHHPWWTQILSPFPLIFSTPAHLYWVHLRANLLQVSKHNIHLAKQEKHIYWTWQEKEWRGLTAVGPLPVEDAIATLSRPLVLASGCYQLLLCNQKQNIKSFNKKQKAHQFNHIPQGKDGGSKYLSYVIDSLICFSGKITLKQDSFFILTKTGK